jgi:hypothetical protein
MLATLVILIRPLAGRAFRQADNRRAAESAGPIKGAED